MPDQLGPGSISRSAQVLSRRLAANVPPLIGGVRSNPEGHVVVRVPKEDPVYRDHPGVRSHVVLCPAARLPASPSRDPGCPRVPAESSLRIRSGADGTTR